MKNLSVVGVLICSVMLSATEVTGVSRRHGYTIADLGTLGGTESFAYAINDRGDIVGSSRLIGNTSTHGFLFDFGVMTDLSPLNSGPVQTVGPTDISNHGRIASGVMHRGVYSPAIYDARTGRITPLGSLGGVAFGSFNGAAVSINDLGEAAGYSFIDDQNAHAFVYKKGKMIDIGSPEGYSAALAINNAGDVAGFASESANGYAHAFVYRKGTMMEINPFGDPNNESVARAISNNGEIVGEGVNGRHTRGFIYSNGSIKTIGTLPGGHNSYAHSINDRGEVVGVADSSNDDACRDLPAELLATCTAYSFEGFLFQRGVMTELKALIAADAGWNALWAFDINNRGQITGYGLKAEEFRAFIMTPVQDHVPKVQGRPELFKNTSRVPGLAR